MADRCELQDHRISTLEEEMKLIKVEFNELKKEVGHLQTQSTKTETLLASFDKKMDKIEKILEGMATDFKTLSTQVVEYRSESSAADKYMEKQLDNVQQMNWADKLFDKDNRLFLYIILGLVAVVMLMAGFSADQITNMFGGGGAPSTVKAIIRGGM